MALYHLFILNDKTGITSMARVRCDSDQQAITEAQNRADDRRVEIWRADRWIGMLERSGN